jgi:hypothetical protein
MLIVQSSVHNMTEILFAIGLISYHVPSWCKNMYTIYVYSLELAVLVSFDVMCFINNLPSFIFNIYNWKFLYFNFFELS